MIYGTVITPVVLCECETWYFILREESRLTVFGNKVVRIKFGPNEDEATGGWKNLYTEKLHNLYS
jgi:hypothetical protein